MKRDWRRALAKAGIDFPENKMEDNIKCPFHSDKTPSLGINVDKGVWICYAHCGDGKIPSLIARYLGISEVEAISFCGEPILTLDIDDSPFYIPPHTVELIGIPNRVPKWIFERGFEKETLRQFGCRMQDRSLVIPVYDDLDRPVGYIQRMPSGHFPKYRYNQGFEKSKVLFGANLVSRDAPFICLTEGPLDAMWLWQCGFNAVALLGATISEHQERLFTTIKTREIAFCLDNDLVGKRATDLISKRLERFALVSYIDLPEEYKDIQEVSDEGLVKALVENRSLIKIKESEEMPSVNQINKEKEESAKTGGGSGVQWLALGNGDQAFVAIVSSGKDDDDYRFDSFFRHVLVSEEGKYSYSMCVAKQGFCDLCERKIQRQKRFGMWVWVYFVDHNQQNDGSTWERKQKDDGTIVYREKVTAHKVCVLPFGQNDIVWEQVCDIVTDKGALNKHIVRIRRTGEKRDTTYLIRATDTVVSDFDPDIVQERDNLPGVVEYLSGNSNSSENSAPAKSKSDNEDMFDEESKEVTVSDDEFEDLF